MNTATAPGITFAVDDVVPATEPLAERRTHEAVREALDGRLESCCDYHGTVVADVRGHPLLAAVHTAFAQHRPLVLSPDAVWITIAQGVAHHMAIHGERLRDRFVAHAGKLKLTVEVDGWVAGSPENPWPEAFAGWAGQIRDHAGATVHDALVCDFTTTGPAELAASHVVMLDVFQRYFHCEMISVCGIPTVTLTGTPADWQRLAAKAETLRVFDMDWWIDHLIPICRHFARAAAGDVDVDHWQSICKLRSQYGGDIINGWVAKLFPYLREWWLTGPCTRRNPIFETGEGFQAFASPPPMSTARFVWIDRPTRAGRSMEAVGGLLGVAQARDTLALRPTVGWAIREGDPFDALLDRLQVEHTTCAGLPSLRHGDLWPAELGKLYQETNGAELFGSGAAAVYRIVPFDRLTQLDWSAGGAEEGHGMQTWSRLVDLRDGSCLAVTLDYNARRHGNPGGDLPICHSSPATQGLAGRNPIIAWSIAELLTQMMNSGGNADWLLVDRGYGDAEAHTRRIANRPPRRRRPWELD